MLGCQSIVHRRDRGAQLAGESAAQLVVLGGIADNVTAAVEPQQCRSRRS